MKKWILLSPKNVLSTTLEEVENLLLKNRGLENQSQIDEFLDFPPLDSLTCEKLDFEKKEIEKAIFRLKEAVRLGEKVIVYGDYDTDGVCATAIMWQTLQSAGAHVLPYIPRREEGYGLKKTTIEKLVNEGVKLIVTVDHGIVANEQVAYAQKLGIDVIVTDHHLPGSEKPPAYAVVHTTKLCGAGVAWFLTSNFGSPPLELAAIGTVADVMPLVGENRLLVKYGLQQLRQTKIPGLLALYEVAGIKRENIGTYEIGFLIGPRLNAAGRMEDPMEALRLLCTKNEERARSLAAKIDQQNKDRQLLTTQTTSHAKDLWLTEDGKGKMIFVSHESYEEGIVGLVAGKLMEEFYRPTIIVAKGEEFCRASARSIYGFNIVEAIRTCSDILGPHGGHALAAGFTVETTRLEELKVRLREIAEKEIGDDSLTPILKVDLKLPSQLMNLDLLERIKNFEPFGFGNPEPSFLTCGLKIREMRLVGSEGKHLKLQLVDPSSGLSWGAIGFGLGQEGDDLKNGNLVDIVYNLTEDSWDGRTKVQLRIKDLKLS